MIAIYAANLHYIYINVFCFIRTWSFRVSRSFYCLTRCRFSLQQYLISCTKQNTDITGISPTYVFSLSLFKFPELYPNASIYISSHSLLRRYVNNCSTNISHINIIYIFIYRLKKYIIYIHIYIYVYVCMYVY